MDAVHKFCNVIYGDKKQCEDGTHNIGQETDTMRRNVTSHQRQDRPRRACLLYIHAHIFVSFIERARYRFTHGLTTVPQSSQTRGTHAA